MKKLVFVVSVSVVAVFVAWYLFGTPSDLRYLQEASGVRLPDGLRNVDTYDNGESFMVAHVGLPPDAIEKFIAENKFAPFDSSDFEASSWMGSLSARWRTVPVTSELFYLAGPTPNSHWYFWLDRKTGDLWVLVRYPDFAGDL